MGNIASTISGSAICIAGAAVVMIAKPACDYTVKLVLKNTSLMMSHQLATLEADIKNAVDIIKDTRESLARVEKVMSEHAADDFIKNTMESLARVEKAMSEHTANDYSDTESKLDLLTEGMEPKISNTEAMVTLVAEGVERTNGAISGILPALKGSIESRISKVEDMVIRTMNSVAKTNEAVNALPKTIDATAKKYSTYLHEEHVSMVELISAAKGDI
jgi:archaellum component FlaC